MDTSARTDASAGRSTRGTVLRYAIAGGTVYAVDIVSLWALRSKAGLPLGVATTLAFCCAFVVNLTVNRSFTFASNGHMGRQAVRLLVLVGLNYVSTLIIVLGLSHVWSAFLASKTIATAVNAVFNFYAYRGWVFKESPAPPRDAHSTYTTTDSVTPANRSSSGNVVSTSERASS